MTTIAIEAHVSTEQLLRAVEQLPSPDLATFVAQVLALRAELAHLRGSTVSDLMEALGIKPRADG